MNALELTQRQRELLGNIIVKTAHQYQQAIADASARLKHELEQIEQSRDKERQRIEEERKEKAKTLARSLKLEDELKLQQAIDARRSTITPPRDITTIEAVKEEINRTSSASRRVGAIIDIIDTIWQISLILSIICGAVSLFGLLTNSSAFVFGCLGFLGGLGLLAGLTIVDKRKSFFVNKIAVLHHLYNRWLELVDEQAGAQRAEAQRRYDQAVAQAKGQMLAAAEQLRPAIAEFGALTEPVSPP